MEQNFKFVTPQGEIVWTVPGKKDENDLKIFVRPPVSRNDWAPSLLCVGAILRLKAESEDRYYLRPDRPNGGAKRLMQWIDAVMMKRNIGMVRLANGMRMPIPSVLSSYNDNLIIGSSPEQKDMFLDNDDLIDQWLREGA